LCARLRRCGVRADQYRATVHSRGTPPHHRELFSADYALLCGTTVALLLTSGIADNQLGRTDNPMHITEIEIHDVSGKIPVLIGRYTGPSIADARQERRVKETTDG
jgi:hypothetical protein